MLALVADDNAAVRRFVGRICAQSGLEVRGCASGSELVQTALRLRPGLIISDFHMPGKPDGLQACAFIRRELPGTAIIMMTGNMLNVAALRKAGFRPILIKPFSVVEAAPLIAAVVRRSCAIMDGENLPQP